MQTRSFTQAFQQFFLIGTLAALLAFPVIATGDPGQDNPPDDDTTDVATEITITDGKITIKGNVGDAAGKLRGPGRGRLTLKGEIDDDGDFVIRTDTEEIEGLIQFGRKVVIDPEDKVVGNVVSVGGPVVVRGEVLGDVVSLGGDVRIEGEGVVNGDAVSVGGDIIKDRTARIRGESVSLGFLPSFYSHSGVFSWYQYRHVKLGLKLGKIVLLMLFCWLALAVAPQRMARFSQAIERSFLLSLLLGFLVVLSAIPLMVLLIVTIVGIPFAVLLPFVLLLFSLVGYAAGAVSIGRRLSGGSLPPTQPAFRAALIGVVVIEGFGVLGMLLGSAGAIIWPLGTMLVLAGWALGAAVTIVGIGSQILTKFGAKDHPAIAYK
jgi:hypothetical protein